MLLKVLYFFLFYLTLVSSSIGKVAQDQTWIKLLYYEKNGEGYRSLVKNKGFFLSKRGMFDPEEELRISKIIIKKAISKSDYKDDRFIHFLCSFPARFEYVSKIMGFPYQKYKCDSFETWRDSFEATGISVIFASQYLSSPASAMGHTYLRIISKKRSLYLNKVIGYSAIVPKDIDTFLYAFKGITGGFVGSFSVDPFYIKFHEYSNIEQRDLWEYKLKLNADQMNYYLKHLWEIINFAKFDYLFATENCSKVLLRSLDILYKNINLTDQLPSLVLPVEILKVLYKSKLITKIESSPSPSKRIIQKFNQLNHSNQQIFQDTLNFLVPSNLEVLDLAIDYLNYKRHAHGGKLNSKDDKFLLRLLTRRSEFDSQAEYHRNRQGHNLTGLVHESNPTKRIGFNIGRNTDRSTYFGIELRPGIHDLIDKVEGYLKYSQVTIFDTSILIYDESNISLKSIDFISMQKLSSYDFLTKNFSWGLNLSLKSIDASKCTKYYYFEFNPSWGIGKKSYEYFSNFILLDFNTKYGNLESHAEIDLGIRFLSILDIKPYKLISEIKPSYHSHEHFKLRLNVKAVYNLDVYHTIKTEVEYLFDEKFKLEFALYRYF